MQRSTCLRASTTSFFSDEKMFRFRSGLSVGVWRRKGADRFSAKYTVKTTQRGEGVMVWAAINSKGETCVRLCPKKMKETDYQALLADALPFIRGSRCTDCDCNCGCQLTWVCFFTGHPVRGPCSCRTGRPSIKQHQPQDG